MPDRSYFEGLVWQIADLLRGPYRPPVAITEARRFDCALADTKAKMIAEYDRDINDVLNLGLPTIRSARSGSLSELGRWWREEKARRNGPVSRQVIEKKLAWWAAASSLQPHSGVAIVELRRRLRKAT